MGRLLIAGVLKMAFGRRAFGRRGGMISSAGITRFSCLFLLIGLCIPILCPAGSPLLAQNGESGVVFLREEAEVRGKMISIWDVAEIRSDDEELLKILGAIELGSAPPLGSFRILTRGYIMLRMRQKGLNPDLILDSEGAEETRVYSPCQKVTSDMMMERLAEHISRRYSKREEQIDISLTRRLQEIILPEGALGIEIMSSRGRNGTSPDFNAEISVNGEVLERIALPVKVRLNAYLPVARRDIGYMSIITGEDVELKEVEISLGGVEAEEGLQGVIGKRALVRIAQGVVITGNMVEALPDVVRGSILKLRLIAGAICIFTPAKALKDGYVGDTIEAEIIETGKIVRCVVRGGGLADIQTSLF